MWRTPIAKLLISRGATMLTSLVCVGIASSAVLGQDAATTMFGVAIRNSVLEQRFTRERNEEESISKVLLNSNVTGSQCTMTETRLRILPDDRSFRFELLNLGNVTSRTTGINREALVESVGRHHFEITKPFWFDGSVFLTLPGHGTIQASQTPQRVVSAAGVAMPLFGPLSDRVAWNEVMRRQPQINRVVAEDVSRDVLPKIDRITDDDFGKLGRQWKVFQQQTNTLFGRTRLKWAARSTDSVAAIWADSDSVAGIQKSSDVVADAIRWLGTREEIVAFVSEEAVATLLSQYSLTGLKISDTQLQKLQLPPDDQGSESLFSPEEFRRRLIEIALADSTVATLFTLEFASENPVQIQFVDGDVRVITTFQVVPKLGPPSGWLRARFNLHGQRLPGNSWAVAIRSVEVGSADGAGNSPSAESDMDLPTTFLIPLDEEKSEDPEISVAQAGAVWIPIVRAAATSLAEKIPPVKLPLEIDGSVAVPGAPRLRISRIDSTRGMLRVSLKIVDEPAAVSSRNR